MRSTLGKRVLVCVVKCALDRLSKGMEYLQLLVEEMGDSTHSCTFKSCCSSMMTIGCSAQKYCILHCGCSILAVFTAAYLPW